MPGFFMMTHRIVILFMTALSMLLLPLSSALAQDTEVEFGKRIKGQIGLAQGYIAKGDYDRGLKKLDDIIEDKVMEPPEQALLYVLKGTTYFEMADDENAIKSFQQAYDTGGLGPNDSRDTLQNIAKLSFAAENYEQSALALEQWRKDGGDPADIETMELLIDSWSYARNFENALAAAEPYFAGLAEKERRHYDLMNFLYGKTGKVSRQADILNQMITLWPNDDVLRQTLSGLTRP